MREEMEKRVHELMLLLRVRYKLRLVWEKRTTNKAPFLFPSMPIEPSSLHPNTPTTKTLQPKRTNQGALALMRRGK